jgi:subtilisin family serine protease
MPSPQGTTDGPLEMIGLPALMALGTGYPEVSVGLVDGPVARGLPDLAEARIHPLGAGACGPSGGDACAHGTFLAGVLVATRGSPALAICPGCTLLVRPIFRDATGAAATPGDVARAIVECVDLGARVINLSAATGGPTTRAESPLRQALDYTIGRGGLVVAAAGNQATLGSSELTRHPGVITVVAYDRAGRPMAGSNLGGSSGRRGVGAPGDAIQSLGVDGAPVSGGGTSVAAAIVTGTASLLWSLFPAATNGTLQSALTSGARRTSVVPPLLNAGAAYRFLADRLGAPRDLNDESGIR